MKKLNQSDIVQKFINKHGEKFDYSKVKYINMKTKVDIVCQNGHIFSQTPDNHLKGKGCISCRYDDDIVDDISSFIKRSIIIHNDKYDYKDSIYIDSKTKIKIICKEHGDFYQTPNLHLSGSGCRECYFDSIRKKKEIFIEDSKRIHNDFYDYSKVNYINQNTKVTINCKLHGDFEQLPSSHLSGSGCKKCMISKFTNTFNDFKNKSHKVWDDEYEYDEKTYINMRINMKVRCKKHGWFKVTPDNHISKKRGCPKCGNNSSKVENDWLDSLKIPDSWRQSIINVDNKIYKLDALDVENKVIYEFYGDYWHGNPLIYDENSINEKNGKRFGELYDKTIERENSLKKLGYKIISIWESDFSNI
jgi:hypothetical protein